MHRAEVKPEPVTLKAVTATIFEDRKVARERRINPYKTVGVALPCYWLVGEKVKIRSCDNGHEVIAEVVDVGPWSTEDEGIVRGERPMAESGKSDSRHHRFRAWNRAGVDLLPATRDALDLPEWEGTFVVDLILLEHPAAIKRRDENEDGECD
jgi:hypothetical protein